MQMKMQSKNYVIDGDADGVIECNFFAQLKNMMNHSEPDQNDDHNTNDNDNTQNEGMSIDGICCIGPK